MPRVCTVCSHPEREAIDTALVSGEPLRGIARRLAVSEDALFRHKRDHIVAALAQATEAATVAADDLLGQVRMLQAKTLAILTTAEAAGGLSLSLVAVREARGNIELLAKLTNQLSDRPTVNVAILPEWATLRALLLSTLAPYPEARAAVAARLTEGPGDAGDG